MITNPILSSGLIVSTSVIIVLLVYLFRLKNKTQLHTFFGITCSLMLIWSSSLIGQFFFSDLLSIDPIKFEYIAYIGACFLPVSLFFTSTIFSNTKIKFKISQLLLCLVPIITLFVIWTNNYHHLFYKQYSINLSNTVTGSYTIVHYIFTYSLFALSLFNLLKYSIKNAGFFSKQSLLIILGALIPIVVNIFGTFNIISMTVYVTPICFAFTILFFALAIFKFKFLSVTPIAMQRIVDRMSDSFLVISEDDNIIDFNDTLLRTFNLKSENVRNINFMDFISSQGIKNFTPESIKSVLEKCRTTEKVILVKRELPIQNNYFNVEASGIFSKNTFLGTLILFKDVTQHVNDMHTIQDNQDMLMEKERLASLGQMVGGIAHNLKTPIMSIAGASEGLNQLTDELDASIGNPVVTNEDYHEIVRDMKEWIEKIKTHTSYMSDVITVVKGQTVAFADDQVFTFNVDTLFKQVDILMKHELKSALVTLRVSNTVPDNCNIKGNINSLVQVLNNIISNAIQAYNGKTDEFIDLSANLRDNTTIEIVVRDYGPGLPEVVQKNLFKQMITTKGKSGTGLGMFMSYSNIKAHFKGNMSFETEKDKGTAFIITIPIEK